MSQRNTVTWTEILEHSPSGVCEVTVSPPSGKTSYLTFTRSGFRLNKRLDQDQTISTLLKGAEACDRGWLNSCSRGTLKDAGLLFSFRARDHLSPLRVSARSALSRPFRY